MHLRPGWGWCLSVGGGPLVAEVLSITCIDHCWVLHVDLLDQHLPLLSLLWWTKLELLLETCPITGCEHWFHGWALGSCKDGNSHLHAHVYVQW